MRYEFRWGASAADGSFSMSRFREFIFWGAILVTLFSGILNCGAFAAESREASALIEGQSLTLEAEVEGGEPPFHFLWMKDYVPILGATNAQLRFESVRRSDAGSYSVVVFNDGGAVTSPIEVMTITAGSFSRLANISIGASARDSVHVGFSLGGSGTAGTTDVLARAAGPALEQFGVLGALRDPVLTLSTDGREVARNDDWTSDDTRAAGLTVGAFPYPELSKDSAVVLPLAPASYTAEVSDRERTTGRTLVELYDTTGAGNRFSPRLLSVAARGVTGGGTSPLTAGFTIEGDNTMTLLLRGVGPSLRRTGLSDNVLRPTLQLFRGVTLVSSNSDWRVATAEIEAAQKKVGATMLDPNDSDAAMIVRLAPGSYSAQVLSADQTGQAQIEVYEIP